jgi:hypothetical protein
VRGHPESDLFLAVTVVADLIETEFVLFIGGQLLAGVADGDDTLNGQVRRKAKKFGDILR